MQLETKYGKVLFHSILTPKEALTRRIVYLIISLGILGGWFFAFWATGHLNPNADPVPLGIGWVILLIISVPIFFQVVTVLFSVKASETAVFEHGLIHSCRSKHIDLAFADITGIRDRTERTTWVVALIVPFLTLSSRSITMYKKDGTKLEIGKGKVRYYDEFADTFNAVYTDYLLSGVTKETISEASITFGLQLELVNGVLEYSPGEDDIFQLRDGKLKFVKGEEGKKIVPFDAIARLQPDGDGGYISLVGKEMENGKPVVLASFKADEAMNMMALYSILEIMQ